MDHAMLGEGIQEDNLELETKTIKTVLKRSFFRKDSGK
jgi:hypothetical protein